MLLPETMHDREIEFRIIRKALQPATLLSDRLWRLPEPLEGSMTPEQNEVFFKKILLMDFSEVYNPRQFFSGYAIISIERRKQPSAVLKVLSFSCSLFSGMFQR